MDISRPDVARRKKLRQALYAATAVIVTVVVPVGVSRLEPAAPRIGGATPAGAQVSQPRPAPGTSASAAR